MITEFGKFLRELRHAHVELLKDMADKLGVSAAFLSAVESGKKNIPAGWEATIADLYRLPADARNALREAIDRSAKSATIDLSNQDANRREIAVALARQFDGLTDAQLELIKKTMFSTPSRKKD